MADDDEKLRRSGGPRARDALARYRHRGEARAAAVLRPRVHVARPARSAVSRRGAARRRDSRGYDLSARARRCARRAVRRKGLPDAARPRAPDDAAVRLATDDLSREDSYAGAAALHHRRRARATRRPLAGPEGLMFELIQKAR